MPVLIDPAKEKSVARRSLEDGVPLELGEMAQQVVMTKYISNDPMHADWQPAEEWLEVVTADVASAGGKARILLPDEGGQPRRLTDDDGYIVKLRGTLTRLIGMVPNLPPLDESQIEAWQEANPGKAVPLYQQWDFRVTDVLKTNGPEGRRALLKGEDQRRMAAQADMFEKQTEVFQNILALFQAGTAAMQAQGVQVPTAQAVVEAGAKALAAKKV